MNPTVGHPVPKSPGSPVVRVLASRHSILARFLGFLVLGASGTTALAAAASLHYRLPSAGLSAGGGHASSRNYDVRSTMPGWGGLAASRSYVAYISPVLPSQLVKPAPRSDSVPVILALDPVSVPEGSAVSIPVVALDADAPPQHLSVSLLPGAPPGMTWDAGASVVRWMPGETEGPGSYRIGLRVTDDGSPALSSITEFVLTVTEANQPPVLLPIPDQVAAPGRGLLVRASATDPDRPTQTLMFTLGPDAPPGASVNRDTGLIHWIPGFDQVGRQVTLEVRVTDSGSPPAVASRRFGVLVPSAPILHLVRSATGDVRLVLAGEPARCLVIEASNDLIVWRTVATLRTDTTGSGSIPIPTPGSHRLLRARVVSCED
ncbi:MAG: cadherin repeat domain-containing protein [Verrucomicrobiales bacterium]|nr:cadherin repeat domain-containing protein [Verrucomicrobiales bacterium]